MIDIQYEPTHHIQQHILDVLRNNEYVRFRDMRPPHTDSNVYSYHLNQLCRHHFIAKTAQGYSLSLEGLMYIDKVSSLKRKPRQLPKIMTMAIIIDQTGEVLVRRKTSQPMIGKVTFIVGMRHIEDVSIEASVLREINERAGLTFDTAAHVGDCYMAVTYREAIVMNALIHVFVVHVDRSQITPHETMFWRSPTDLDDAAPATKRLAAELPYFNPQQLFFREYSEEL